MCPSSEETREAATGAGKGVWQAIFYSAIGGWILLICFFFAATNVDAINKNPFGYIVIAVFQTSLGADSVQDRDDHLDRRADLLRRLRDDVGVADDVRVQPRPCVPGLAALVEGQESRAPRNATMFIAVVCAIVASRHSRVMPRTRRLRSSH